MKQKNIELIITKKVEIFKKEFERNNMIKRRKLKRNSINNNKQMQKNVGNKQRSKTTN